MISPRAISVALKASRELGAAPLLFNGLYRLGLQSGWYKRRAQSVAISPPIPKPKSILDLPTREQILNAVGEDGLRSLLAEADEILAGKVRLFGAQPVELTLAFTRPLSHWTAYETNPDLLSAFNLPHNDIKFLWEPARFAFAFTFGRAYHLTGEERYAAAFWRHFETFGAASPPYLGPNWMSGQEVALRLMVFVWAGQAFATSPHSTPERLARLADSIAAHAARIPPTLVYARSQNNNHLLTEAAGLYTASLALPAHPQAAKWRVLGQKWLNWCFENQIDEAGEYVQHSTNYHRLMLQIALWLHAIASRAKDDEAISSVGEATGLPPRDDTAEEFLSGRARQNLARSTQWLLALTDPQTGHVPNLGANDGAHILPLSCLPFDDFRPTLQAASLAFCGTLAFGPGPWDETGLWLGVPRRLAVPAEGQDAAPLSILRSPQSRAYLRATHFASRPSHADQLHLDLWWRSLNITLDPGTYLYNADPPWDNALTSALVHNTVTVSGHDQMTRAGKFLYLDWAQARLLELGADRISAQHDGYRRLGVIHRRTLTAVPTGWRVSDELVVARPAVMTYRLHWLLPDWQWSLQEAGQEIKVTLQSPYGSLILGLAIHPAGLPAATTLVRTGQYVSGSGPADLIRGWASPTYGLKVPALSLAVEVESSQTVGFMTEFSFPATA